MSTSTTSTETDQDTNIVEFSTSFNGKKYIILPDEVDTSTYKSVTHFKFTLRHSDFMSIAETDAFVDSIAPKQVNNTISPSASNRVYSLGYVLKHTKTMERDKKDVRPVTLKVLQDLGETILNFIHYQCEVEGQESFFLETPLSGEMDGEKRILENSSTL